MHSKLLLIARRTAFLLLLVTAARTEVQPQQTCQTYFSSVHKQWITKLISKTRCLLVFIKSLSGVHVQAAAGPGTEAEANLLCKARRLQLCSSSRILTLNLQMHSLKMILQRRLKVCLFQRTSINSLSVNTISNHKRVCPFPFCKLI